MNSRIKELSEKYYERTKELRHLIHMYPEEGYKEYKTSELVINELNNLNIKVQNNIAKTGVIGLIEGKYPGKTVLLRADMDALKLEERADVQYKSKVPGMMHACGHDGHVAGLLGAAMILNDLKDYLHGNVKLMFQPAEERDGGAKPMIDEGILENPKVDAVFGAHLWGLLKENQVHVKHGAMMAAPDIFTIKIIGVGGHGSAPHKGIDSIVLASQVINSLQTIVSRKINPLNPVVLSFGRIEGGDCHNVIPNEVEIEGTVRTFSDEDRELVPKLMEDLIKGITLSQGANYEFVWESKYPALINDDKMTDLVKESATKILGVDNVFELKEATMGGEDFSYLTKVLPGSFFFVGIAKDENQPVLHHNPYFEWDDSNLKVLTQCLSQVAIDYLNN
ncbi:MAG: M20 metallopeptidase family protein [Peptostreptococcaceae bacterium]